MLQINRKANLLHFKWAEKKSKEVQNMKYKYQKIHKKVYHY